MKTLRKTLIPALLIIFAGSTVTLAQNDQRQRQKQMQAMQKVSLEERADIRIAVMNDYMDLSEEESARYREAFLELEKKAVQKIRGTRNQPRKRRMEASKLRKEHMKEMQKILTKEHFTVFLEKHEAIQFDIRQRLRTIARTDDQ